MTHPKKMLGVIQAHMIVKLVVRSTLQSSAAQFHTCNKASRDHQVVSLEELEANPQLASVSLICLKHNDEFRFLMRNWSCSL